jgi:hypothetical protein
MTMIKTDMYVPKHIAKMILEMEDHLMSEGIGPDTDELMYWIYVNYPQLFHPYGWSKLYISAFNDKRTTNNGDGDE